MLKGGESRPSFFIPSEATMHLVPAYGRDYKSKKAVQEDFDKGLDFKIQDISSRWDGCYTNKEDLQKAGVTAVTIRYASLSRVCIIRVT